MIYVYCPRPSNGARDLVAWLREEGEDARRVRRCQAPPEGLVVCWGYPWELVLPRVPVLNATAGGGKHNQLVRLAEAGVPVPAHSRTYTPGWLVRTNHHHGANDLLANLPPERGHYFVQPVDTVREFRIHVFRGRSIRAALKEPREGAVAHPMFRTTAAGWRFEYGDRCQAVIRNTYRDVAKKAVAALGLDFGAVDLAITDEGSVVVWEVNCAPGLEGGTVPAYGRKIQEVLRGAAEERPAA